MGKIHGIVAGVALTGAILGISGQEAFSQSTGNSNGKANIGQVQKGTQDEIAEIDTLSHKTIINMSLEKLLQRYGEEKGREVIKQHMLMELNNVRKKEGLGPLKFDAILNLTAQEYAQYCAENNHFDHIDLEGKNQIDRVKKHGYQNDVSENLFRGSDYAIYDAIEFWTLLSKGHAKNIRNAQNFCGIGAAVSKSGYISIVLILD